MSLHGGVCVCVCVDLCVSVSDTMTPKALALFPQQAGLWGEWQSIRSQWARV